jgi:type III secretion protein SpaR/YscT/HrcT
MSDSLIDHANSVFIYLPRASVALAFLPLFNKAVVPALLRVTLGLGLAMWFAAVAPISDDTVFNNIYAFIAKETLIGFALAITFGTVFWAFESAGQIIDFYTGLTAAQQADPANANQTSPLSTLLSQFVKTYVVAIGGILLFLRALSESFYLLKPTGQAMSVSNLYLSWVSESASTLFSLAVLVAAPICLALFFVDVCVGFANKTASSLEVSGVTSGLKGLLALFLLASAVPLLAERLAAISEDWLLLLRSMISAIKTG